MPTFKTGDIVRIDNGTYGKIVQYYSSYQQPSCSQSNYYNQGTTQPYITGQNITGQMWYVELEGSRSVNCYYDYQLTLVHERLVEVNKEQQNKVEKIYRALKDSYLFSIGAILSNKDSFSVYKPVDDIWHNEETPELKKYLNDNGIGISAGVVENTPSWFERVYSVKSIKGMYYVAKDKMKEMLSKGVIDDGSEAK